MGAKQKLEIAKGIDGVIDILTKIAVQNGIIISELKHIRVELRDWMTKDVEHHYEKEKKNTEILETLVNGNGRKGEMV